MAYAFVCIAFPRSTQQAPPVARLRTTTTTTVPIPPPQTILPRPPLNPYRSHQKRKAPAGRSLRAHASFAKTTYGQVVLTPNVVEFEPPPNVLVTASVEPPAAIVSTPLAFQPSLKLSDCTTV